MHFQVHSVVVVTELTEAVMTSENYCTTTLWTILDKQILSRKLVGKKIVLSLIVCALIQVEGKVGMLWDFLASLAHSYSSLPD